MAVPKSLRMSRRYRGGGKGRGSAIAGVQERLESRVGKVPLLGRYHGPSRHIESDYDTSDQVLGTGISGAVFMATRKGQPQTKFAVKALALSGLRSAQLERLKSEVENFLCMDHPHITRLHDCYESKTHMHLVMECLEGGELFDRVSLLGRFCEADAAEAMWQMLLAVNYIHSRGCVHRDIKLENFLYDRLGGNHLKLLDFGFSKMWDPNSTMHEGIGTMAYMAPEVLSQSYTSQCDLWSLGVVCFILLAGYMPFSGSHMLRKIQLGEIVWKEKSWSGISQEARSFVLSLMDTDPTRRLTAQSALLHPWFTQRPRVGAERPDADVVRALRGFASQPAFRRCCLEMIAWVLSNEERSRVRNYFISMDANRQGTVTREELRMAMEALGTSDDEVAQVFSILDANHDNEIQYSDFLAAMVSTKIDLNEDLLDAAFRKFDCDGSGDISAQDLRAVLGDTFEGERVEALLSGVTKKHNNRISYPEFVAYLCQTEETPVPTSSAEVRCRTTAGLESRLFPRFLPAVTSVGSAVKGICSAVLCGGPIPKC